MWSTRPLLWARRWIVSLRSRSADALPSSSVSRPMRVRSARQREIPEDVPVRQIGRSLARNDKIFRVEDAHAPFEEMVQDILFPSELDEHEADAALCDRPFCRFQHAKLAALNVDLHEVDMLVADHVVDADRIDSDGLFAPLVILADQEAGGRISGHSLPAFSPETVAETNSLPL